MRSIILAAGRGSRMGALTAVRPKCMMSLKGQPLLTWQLAALREAEVEQVGIVCGYLSHLLPLENLARFCNPHWAETNMVASLCCAASWLRYHSCIVSYSDIVYPPATIRRLSRAEGDVVITYDRDWLSTWKLRFSDPLQDAETFRVDSKGALLEIGNHARSVEEIQGQYMGLLKFSPAGWERVEVLLAELPREASDRLDMTSLLRTLVQTGTSVRTVPISGEWFEVDSEEDLRLCRDLLSRGVRPFLSDWWNRIGNIPPIHENPLTPC